MAISTNNEVRAFNSIRKRSSIDRNGENSYTSILPKSTSVSAVSAISIDFFLRINFINKYLIRYSIIIDSSFYSQNKGKSQPSIEWHCQQFSIRSNAADKTVHLKWNALSGFSFGFSLLTSCNVIIECFLFICAFFHLFQFRRIESVNWQRKCHWKS